MELSAPSRPGWTPPGPACQPLSTPLFLVQGDRPGLVGAVGFDRRSERGRVRAQVLLVDVAIVVDLERLDSRDAVGGGPGDGGESADHHSLDDVVARAQARRRAL